MSNSSASSATIHDDSTSHTLSPTSPTPTPSPAFIHIDSSPSPDSSNSESSPELDNYVDLFNPDCDVVLPGAEDIFGNIVENHELWSDNIEDLEDVNMSADTLDRILVRAEMRLKEQEAFAEKLNIQLASGPEVISLTKSQNKLPAPYMDSTKRVVRPDNKALVTRDVRDLANKPKVIQDPINVQKSFKNKKPDTLSTHFDLPRTKVTPSLKRDLQLIHMRSVLDPKRMYKKQGGFKIPEYSQVGTIIEGATEFYSSRLSKAERMETLVDETLATEAKSGKLKSKYQELQKKQRSGKKAFYRSLVAQRKKRIK